MAQRKWATCPGSLRMSGAGLGFLWLWGPELSSAPSMLSLLCTQTENSTHT